VASYESVMIPDLFARIPNCCCVNQNMNARDQGDNPGQGTAEDVSEATKTE